MAAVIIHQDAAKEDDPTDFPRTRHQRRSAPFLFQHSAVAAEILAGARDEAGYHHFHDDWIQPVESLGRVITPGRDGDASLLAEGIGPERIRFVGNVVIDTLERILRALEAIARDVPVVFPMHSRTCQQAGVFGLQVEGVRVLDPVGYKDMLALQSRAGLVVTDSGGVQEQTTVLGVPCLTLRDSTERPVTVTEGTNRLVPDRSTESILEAFRASWGRPAPPPRPEGWDGHAAERVADAVEEWVGW
jgi:UDP-N-acetylglucosamine 2-epimerase